MAAPAAVLARAALEDQLPGAEPEGEARLPLDRVLKHEGGAVLAEGRGGRVARRVVAGGLEFIGAVGVVVGAPAGDQSAPMGDRGQGLEAA